MNKFKVGDIIVGKDCAHLEYSITNKLTKWKGRVTEVISQSHIMAITISISKEFKPHVGSTFPLDSKFFDLERPKGPYLSNQGTKINV